MNPAGKPTELERAVVRRVIGEFLHTMQAHADKLKATSRRQADSAERMGEDSSTFAAQYDYADHAERWIRYCFSQLGSNRSINGSVFVMREDVQKIIEDYLAKEM